MRSRVNDVIITLGPMTAGIIHTRTESKTAILKNSLTCHRRLHNEPSEPKAPATQVQRMFLRIPADTGGSRLRVQMLWKLGLDESTAFDTTATDAYVDTTRLGFR